MKRCRAYGGYSAWWIKRIGQKNHRVIYYDYGAARPKVLLPVFQTSVGTTSATFQSFPQIASWSFISGFITSINKHLPKLCIPLLSNVSIILWKEKRESSSFLKVKAINKADAYIYSSYYAFHKKKKKKYPFPYLKKAILTKTTAVTPSLLLF